VSILEKPVAVWTRAAIKWTFTGIEPVNHESLRRANLSQLTGLQTHRQQEPVIQNGLVIQERGP